jgi:hypothetical protein
LTIPCPLPLKKPTPKNYSDERVLMLWRGPVLLQKKERRFGKGDEPKYHLLVVVTFATSNTMTVTMGELICGRRAHGLNFKLKG